MNKSPKMNKKLYIISIIVAVFVITTSIGYGLFSKSLSINGVATTLDYYSGTKLPHTPVDLNNKHQSYFSTNFNDEYTYLTNARLYTEGYYFTFVDDSWNDDTYLVRFDKKMLGGFEGKSITYNVSFANPTALTYTDGVVTTESGNVLSGTTVSTATGTSSDVSSATASLSATTLAPNDQVTVSLTITLGTMNFSADTVVKARVGYRLYSGSSGMRYFNFIIKYDSSITNTSIVDDSDLMTTYAAVTQGVVTKVNNGYVVSRYPATSYDRNDLSHDKLVVDLKTNLEAGATYRMLRGYHGDVVSSAGLVSIRSNSAQLAGVSGGAGIRYVDFTFTQEQIDSIDRMYIYGLAPASGTGLFTFIRIIKISD